MQIDALHTPMTEENQYIKNLHLNITIHFHSQLERYFQRIYFLFRLNITILHLHPQKGSHMNQNMIYLQMSIQV